MNSFLIFANPDKDNDLGLSNELVNYIENKGGCARIVVDEFSAIVPEANLQDIDAVIVLGGDGTMLRAAHYIGESGIPLMGINLGTLGFLTEIEQSNARNAIDRLFDESFNIEERMMCNGLIGGSSYNALNDIVISRAGFSRVIGLKIYVNGQLLDTYEADGVIVATPTGSTGYNLSAGGPIVSPKSKAILVTPISPHSLTAKSVVFDTDAVIEIEIVKQRKTQDKEAIVSVDGVQSAELSAGDMIKVAVSDIKVRFIKLYNMNFYRVLRDKIGGGNQ